jgi:Domain of unknown function (DUF4136)
MVKEDQAMGTAILTASAWLTLLGTIALSQNVNFDYDRTANFSAYKTFAWTRGTELPDELNHARIVRSVEERLLHKGLARVEPGDSPDVLVAYHTSFDKNFRIDGFSTGWGPLGLGPDRFGSATIQPILVGTLVVDVIDARRRVLVWRGMASGDIKPNDKPEQRDKKLAKALEKVFRNYPPKS